MIQGSLVRKLVFASGMLLTAVSQPASAISINLNFVGGLTPSQQDVFTQAGLFWESVLVGYQTGITIPSVTINAEGAFIDGPGGTLGSAGPTSFGLQGGFVLTTVGGMIIDSADLTALENNGSLEDVTLHEMAHALGLGTLWSANGVYMDGSGKYTGANGLAMWQSEFDQPGATFVPVELEGGLGIAGSHWNENFGGGGLTGITDGNGNDMRYELMTGWLDTPTFVSNTTQMSFMDIGYEVTLIPVPAAVWLFVSGFGMLFGFASRKRQTVR